MVIQDIITHMEWLVRELCLQLVYSAFQGSG
jgi:hypothetical protein